MNPNKEPKTPMPTNPVSSFLSKVQAAEVNRDVTADGDLLTAYLQTRDEVAFAALVHRHAPMVWRVCRRILRHQHDAEDAFQAAFLVLVHKAAGIADRASVGNWLYGVAHQTAVRVRANAMKMNRRERQGVSLPDSSAPESRGDVELRDIIDIELVALPDKYRAVVVLCDLEERPRSEVARRLGVPEGTVAGRLARARELLAKRFARRGLVLPGGIVGSLIVGSGGTASVPAAVIADTVTAACMSAGGHFVTGVASAQAMAVSNAVRRSMTLAKLRLATLVVVIGAVCSTSGFAVYLGVGGRETPLPTPVAVGDHKAGADENPDTVASGTKENSSKSPDEGGRRKGKDEERDEDHKHKGKRDSDDDDESKNGEDDKPKKKD